MDTSIFKENEIALAAELLKAGEIVAFPTETVYGLGARIFSEEAINKIFIAKGRPRDNPLIAHISDFSQVEKIAREIPPLFHLLADAFFPGPLTVILKKHPSIPECVSAGLDTIAFRMPAHSIACRLIEAVGEPIVAPSANLSGRPSSTDLEHVLHDFQGKIAGVIEGGSTHYGIESTVVSLIGPKPRLLRPGAISAREIEIVLGTSIEIATGIQEGSPGMAHRHYCPNLPVRVFLTLTELSSYLEKYSEKRFVILKPESAFVDYANTKQLLTKTLYSELRLAEKSEVDEVLIYCSPETKRDLALTNRIFRAAE